MESIRPLPGTLDQFVAKVETNVHPHRADMSMLWSMVYYNIKVGFASDDWVRLCRTLSSFSKLSVESLEKLRRTTTWLSKLRRSLEICNRCMDSCNDANEPNELLLELPAILDPLLSLLNFSVKGLLNSTTGKASSYRVDLSPWPDPVVLTCCSYRRCRFREVLASD
jgi:hypothetical protein